MSNAWSREQVDALAPDPQSLKAAQKLLSPAKWPLLGANDVALWGECKGSGKKPYLTRIDLTEPAFKCSCPSRKFPCKHALALFHLYVADSSSFDASSRDTSAVPDWVTEWLDSRGARKEAKAQKASDKASKPVDTKAQAKRIASREQKVQDGLAELSLWLHDLVRAGLADIPNKKRGIFRDMSARLVDAQMPGLARRVRDLSMGTAMHSDWTTRLACDLGQLQLIISTYERQEELTEGTRADVRRVVGWTDNQQEMMVQTGVVDEWLVLAQQQTQEERLRVRKSWLWGKSSGGVALILEFAHGNTPFQSTLAAGKKWTGEVVFYPSNYPQRAAIKEQGPVTDVTQADVATITAYAGFDEMLAGYAGALAQNCWLEDFAIYLRQVTPSMGAEKVNLLDQQGAVVPLSDRFHDGWTLLAISGGHPIDLIAEWDGTALLPLAVWQEGVTLLKVAG